VDEGFAVGGVRYVDGCLHPQNVAGQSMLGGVAGVERTLQSLPGGEEPFAVLADDAFCGVGPIQVVEFQVGVGGQASGDLRERHLHDLGGAFDPGAHPGSFVLVVGGDDQKQRPVRGEQPTLEAAQARIYHSQHPQYRWLNLRKAFSTVLRPSSRSSGACTLPEQNANTILRVFLHRPAARTSCWRRRCRSRTG
jgi:hypothetical protein